MVEEIKNIENGELQETEVNPIDDSLNTLFNNLVEKIKAELTSEVVSFTDSKTGIRMEVISRKFDIYEISNLMLQFIEKYPQQENKRVTYIN